MRPARSTLVGIALAFLVAATALANPGTIAPVAAGDAQAVFLNGGPPPGQIEPAQLMAMTRAKRVASLERAARWKDSLESKLRCLEKDISLNRFLLTKMQRLYSPRISPTYYTEYGRLCSKLRCALVKRTKLRYLIGVAAKKVEDEATFCRVESLD